jgi:inositol transport system ATP-binding protein
MYIRSYYFRACQSLLSVHDVTALWTDANYLIMKDTFILQMQNIRKTYPGVVALDGVDINIKKGQIHALVGENGAGKSTLMKILNGVCHPDSGKILLQGKEVKINNPHTAILSGIAMIYQELNPVPNMTIAENIFLGREIHGKFGWINTGRMIQETRKVLDRLECSLDPSTKMDSLTISNKQIVEIAKAILYNAEIIVMDEPTSAITDKEVEKLFTIIDDLKKSGTAVIYITHRMDEIFRIADHVTVLRDGRYINDKTISELTRDQLITMLVGRELSEIYPKVTVKAGKDVLEVNDLCLSDHYNHISFTLRSGEILGVAGLVGSGRTEIFETIAGIRRPDSGEIKVNGEVKKFKNPGDAIAGKIVIATEDRKGTGLFPGLAIKDNVLSSSYHKFFPSHYIIEAKVREIVANQMGKFGIKAPNAGRQVCNLSGGNQQKVVLSKVLLTDPDVIILDEPTRGIDIGAKSEIYRIITQFVQQGKCVIMISSELPEILGMSDRIMVICRGEIAGVVQNSADITQEHIFSLACGEAG